MSRFTTRFMRLPRFDVVALGVTTAVALTACGAGSDTGEAARASATPQGVVSQATAKKITDNYEKVNNQANAGQDEKLLATVEAGQVYAMDEATYTLFPTWSESDRKAYSKPFYYQDRSYVIPEKGTATWFAVQATANEGDHDSVLLVFDKVDGTYKMVLSLWADDGQPLPKLAVDEHGLAEAVDPATKVGPLAPAEVGAAYEDLFATGGTKDGKSLASTELVQQAVKTYQDSSTKGTADGIATKRFFAKTPADTSVYALRTADGGVLAMFPTAHNQESLVKEAYRSSRSLVPSDGQSALGAIRGDVITDVLEGQGMAELTATAARITAIGWQQVDSR
ncbi:hypothetical protein ACFYPC_27400 [Streptomyces sp. NPDC005808]|uniref:hypothetical protein n=1 Tax=Streptomyces sp. NPDC005808 TaxID=3364734 RepID=UPI0036854F6F